ncbi:hypothetical protein FHS01_005771 [Longimicrobium terrae]|uniref:Uncharacterized protein n=1 Tax=Longimicrobium terrae TaxID=1639882 RepID=A0A841H8S8_9BACT|nr:hypothetical protein [Longimicrobium terrae]MBB6074089.1 hypothetical protein [Longimicrobium terrae]
MDAAAAASRGFPLLERRIHSLKRLAATPSFASCYEFSPAPTLPRSFSGEGGPVVPARVGAALEPALYTNALWPVMARPTISVFISLVPSYE